MAKKKSKVAKDIVRGLKKFTKALKSGRPVSEKFRVTKAVRNEDGTATITRRGPTKP